MSDLKENSGSRNPKKKNTVEEERAGEQTARLRIIASEDMVGPKKESKKSILKDRSPIRISDKYKRRYAILYAVVVFLFIIAYQFVKVRDIDFKKLDAELSNTIKMEDFQKGSDLTIRKLYGINRDEFVDFISYAPKTNMQANEILIIQCKPKLADSVLSRIQSRVDSQSNSFKNYAPDQYKIIANSQIKKRGDYVYFISLKNHDGVNKAIKNSYK